MVSEGITDERIHDLPEMHLDRYFSRRWIVATQVQALMWYKYYLQEVMQNGFLLLVNLMQ